MRRVAVAGSMKQAFTEGSHEADRGAGPRRQAGTRTARVIVRKVVAIATTKARARSALERVSARNRSGDRGSNPGSPLQGVQIGRMWQRLACIASVSVLLALGGTVSARADEVPQASPITRQMEEMRALDGKLSGQVADAERFRRLTEFYRARFSGLQASSVRAAMSDEDLRALTLAAQLAVFYHHDGDILDDAMADLRLLEDRGAARPGDIRAAYGLLVAGRRFEQARHFLAAHPDLDEPEPPRLLRLRADASGAAEMRVGETDGTLEWSPVDVATLPRILVIGHPSCHFTRNAAHAIEADPELRALFVAQSKWLAPQDTGTDFTVFHRWNTEHPDLPMTIAYRAAGFPIIDHWATPTFYFLDRGRVVSKVIGWPRGGRREEILAAYREAFPDTAPSSER